MYQTSFLDHRNLRFEYKYSERKLQEAQKLQISLISYNQSPKKMLTWQPASLECGPRSINQSIKAIKLYSSYKTNELVALLKIAKYKSV